MLLQNEDKQIISRAVGSEISVRYLYRGLWQISTPARQSWVFKKITLPSLHFLWWSKVSQDLNFRHFYGMPNFFLLKNGWLTSFIVGQNCTYKSVTEAKACVRRLASFHCSGYRVAIKAKKKRPLLFAARMKRRLANFYRLSKAQVSGRLGVILKQQGPQFYFEGLKSWDLLCRLNYQAYCTDCWQERLLTHRDLASHNFMIDKNNKTWLIDFETAEYDAQIGDLGQVITRILAMHKWSAELFKVLLKAYEAIMPLNAYQHEILLLLLRFPNEFFREALGLAERKPGYNPKKTMAYLEKLIAENHYRHSLIHSLS